MGVSEAARADLYHGLAEILGTERAETLMTALPAYDISDLATKSDVAILDAKLEGLDRRLEAVETIVAGLGTRMDRMFLAMLAGLFVIVATMAGVLLTV